MTMELQKKILHAKLKKELMNHISPQNDCYCQFIMHLKAYLPETDIVAAKTDITKAFDSLELKGHLAEGRYDVLKEILENIHVPAVEIIKKFQQEFKKLENGENNYDIHSNASTAAATASNDENVVRPCGIPLFVRFDFVATHLSSEKLQLGIELGLQKDEIDNITIAYQGFPNEPIFQMLYKWYTENIDLDHEKVLNRILSEKLKRNDVVMKLSELKMEKFEYQESGMETITEKDCVSVASKITYDAYRLLRFLKLKQETIDNIRIHNNQNAIQSMLITWKNEATPHCTRNQLCSALKYVKRNDIMKILEAENWGNNPKNANV